MHAVPTIAAPAAPRTPDSSIHHADLAADPPGTEGHPLAPAAPAPAA